MEVLRLLFSSDKASKQHHNESPVKVLDLTAVQGWQRQQRQTQHSANRIVQVKVAVGILLLVLNLVLLCILLVVVGLSLTQEQKRHGIQHRCNISALISHLRDDFDYEKFQKDLSKRYFEDSNLNKPAAHCILDQDNAPREGYMVDVPWSCDGQETVKHHVNYGNGSLTITSGGYYMVYSTITYNGSGTTELEHGRIIHRVVKHQNGHVGETTLMQNLQSTPTIRRGRPAFTSSSLGGTFYLDRGSNVKVLTSVPSNILKSRQASVFGVFLI